MYELHIQDDILFCMFYAAVAMMAMMASCYLLLRRGNAFDPSLAFKQLMGQNVTAWMRDPAEKTP